MDLHAPEKELAARAAVALVEPDMLVGLGTGSTAAFVVSALGQRMREGLRIDGVVGTSLGTEAAARAAGLPLRPFDDVARVDLCLDGVDQIDGTLQAIKGGGGAMLREKIVAEAATCMVAIADCSKRVERLARAVPIEVLPFARAFVLRRLADLGAVPTLRAMPSDNGNLLVDAAFGPLADPASLAATLSAIPGVLGHGIFLGEIDLAFVAEGSQVTRLERTDAPTI